MSHGPESLPEMHCNDQPMRFLTLVEWDEDDHGPRSVHQYFYLPIDAQAGEKIARVLETNGTVVSFVDIVAVELAARGCIVSRSLPQRKPEWAVSVTYDLGRWPTPLRILADPDGSITAFMEFEHGESFASFDYAPDGTLNRLTLEQDRDTDPQEEMNFINNSAQEIEQFLKTHPDATEQDVKRMLWRRAQRWARLETGKNSVAEITGGTIHFYDDGDAYFNQTIAREEALMHGKEYRHFGDAYTITLNEAGTVLITETVRETGRRRMLTAPLNIGNACTHLRDPNSFYWAQIPWLLDIRAEIIEPGP